MLSRADFAGTRPLTRVEAITPTTPAGDARQETFSRFTQIALGKQLQASVVSRFDDGTFLVRVAESPVRMALPAGTRVGERMDMTLLSREPRPTFLLGRTADADSAAATLSAAGRMINAVLQESRQQGVPMALMGKTPLLASGPPSAPQVAASLHGALAFSGLFYESHVAQWAGGTRKLADLLREPQAGNGTPNPPSKPGANDLHPSARLPVPGAEAIATGESAFDESGGEPKTTPLGAETTRLVGMQLETLEQRRVLWQGELWEGQPLEWEVSEEKPEHDRYNDEGERAWLSTVRFTLPSLGEVTATIRLAQGRVSVQAHTASESAAASLLAHRDMLASALDAAGSSLEVLTVRRNDIA